MKKTLALALSLALSFGLLAGCGNSGSSSTAETGGTASTGGTGTAATGDAVNLKWALWDVDLTAYYEPLITAYEAANPGVTIEMIDLGSADYSTALTTQLAGGSDLDVVMIKDTPGYNNLVRQGHLEPLNSFIASEGIDTSLYGGVVENFEVGGEVYALPFRTDFWVIFYNKDIFDDAGIAYPTNDMTLEEYDALARQLTSGSGGDKVYGAHYHTWRSTVQLFSILDGQNTIVDGTYDFMAPYYETILAQQADGIVMNYSELNTTSTHYSSVFFNNQVAMLNMGSWFIATQIEKVDEGESMATNWGIVKYPHPEGVAAGTTLGTATLAGVNKNSANKEQALDFLTFITGEEGAAILADTGTIPAIMNDDVTAKIASIAGFPQDENSIEALNYTKTYLEFPLHDLANEIEVVLNEVHAEIMQGSMTVEEGIEAMNERVGDVLS